MSAAGTSTTAISSLVVQIIVVRSRAPVTFNEALLEMVLSAALIMQVCSLASDKNNLV